ncbi:hypothetical protein EJP82_18300 [Paenibacillus anaericanus]|uniref:O-antigen ligase-related domain-containing protein n=2 Tax=Paenibacillus TaxID=44249 RepID=A0A433Y5K5_9BACL|nr:hypothetical protein EJP82_18300 [Paenibacillus anaericanus]
MCWPFLVVGLRRLGGEISVRMLGKISKLRIVGVVSTGLLVIFNNGMFYTDSLFTLLLISVWLVITAVAIAINLRGETSITLLSWKVSLFRNFLWIWICPFIIAGLYGIHLAIGPLSYQSTYEALFRWLFYGVFGMALFRVSREKRGRHWLKVGWVAMASLLTISALSTLYGVVVFPHVVLRTGDGEIAAAGARLGGLLQYPNTFGAIMAAFLLERLMALASLSGTDKSRKVQLQGYGTAALALLIALCLLLSESRGAYAAAGVGWIAGWFLLRGKIRLSYLLQSGIIVSAAAFCARQLVHAKLAPSPLPGLISLVAVMVVALLLSRLAVKWMDSWWGWTPGNLVAYFYGAACLLTIGALITYAGLMDRLFRLGTLTARATMYGDASDLYMDSPWIGYGGDAWRILFRKVQSMPYVGTEVHSGYLDLLLDLGAVGLMILLLGLISMLVGLIKLRSALLPSFVVLILHSAIDFDMSYGLSWILMIWIAGLGLHEPIDVKIRDRMIHSVGLKTMRILYGLVAVLLLLISLKGFTHAESLRLYSLASQPGKNVTPMESVSLLKRSLALNQSRTSARMALAGMSNSATANLILMKGIYYDTTNPDLWLALGTILALKGDMRAIPTLEHVAYMDRFDREIQSAVLRNLTLLAMRLERDNDLDKVMLVVSTGEEIYLRYAKLTDQVIMMKQLRNDRGFKLTDESKVWGMKLSNISDRIALSTADLVKNRRGE